MGAPVNTGIENFEEAILRLSISDRARLIGWISETMVEEEEKITDAEKIKPSGALPAAAEVDEPPGLGEIRFPKACSKRERAEQLDQLNGSWAGSESAEELIEAIYSSRTTNDRAYLHNE